MNVNYKFIFRANYLMVPLQERTVTFYRTQQTKFKKKCYLWIVYVRATIHNNNISNLTILQTSIFNIYKCIYITTEKGCSS